MNDGNRLFTFVVKIIDTETYFFLIQSSKVCLATYYMRVRDDNRTKYNWCNSKCFHAQLTAQITQNPQ